MRLQMATIIKCFIMGNKQISLSMTIVHFKGPKKMKVHNFWFDAKTKGVKPTFIYRWIYEIHSRSPTMDIFSTSMREQFVTNEIGPSPWQGLNSGSLKLMNLMMQKSTIVPSGRGGNNRRCLHICNNYVSLVDNQGRLRSIQKHDY